MQADFGTVHGLVRAADRNRLDFDSSETSAKRKDKEIIA